VARAGAVAEAISAFQAALAERARRQLLENLSTADADLPWLDAAPHHAPVP
jgi:hypothetical protein